MLHDCTDSELVAERPSRTVRGKRGRDKHPQGKGKIVSFAEAAGMGRQTAEALGPPARATGGGPTDDGEGGAWFYIRIRGLDGKTYAQRVSCGPDSQLSWTGGRYDAADGTQRHTFSISFKQGEIDWAVGDASGGPESGAQPGWTPVPQRRRRRFIPRGVARHGGPPSGYWLEQRDDGSWATDAELREEQAKQRSGEPGALDSEI